jgi:hypothetical protein
MIPLELNTSDPLVPPGVIFARVIVVDAAAKFENGSSDCRFKGADPGDCNSLRMRGASCLARA